MYQAFGLLQPESNFTLEAAVARLAAKLPSLSARREDGLVTLSGPEWEIHLQLNAGPDVLAESAEIAEKIAGDVDGADIARCDRRVEVASDVPDPFMEHFNDFMAVIEVLQSFPGVIAVDPREPCLM